MPSTPTEAVLDVTVQGHRQWTDAYLLHLSRKHGLVLASLESRIANLDDPAKPAPFLVAGLLSWAGALPSVRLSVLRRRAKLRSVTPAQQFYLVLADAVLAIHFAFVAFVVCGLALIWIGRWCRWGLVRNAWFRVAHLAAIAVVAAESLAGFICPLTTWENQLRLLAGAGERYEGTFVQHWLHRLMFFDFNPHVFTIGYSIFFLLVAFSFWLVPVRWLKHSRDGLSSGQHPTNHIP